MHKMLLDLPARLDTERLILRPYQAGDGPAYYQLAQNNKLHLLPFEADNPALSINTQEDAEILVREFAAEWAARKHLFYGGWEKTSGGLVVQIYMAVINWDSLEFEIGFFVDKDHEGVGFVTESVKAMLRFIFECLGSYRVSASCNDMNIRSQRVIERCGFIREGHIRQNKQHIKRDDGAPSGDYLYGMLKEDYERITTSSPVSNR